MTEEKCPYCNGRGYYRPNYPTSVRTCDWCSGTGWVKAEDTCTCEVKPEDEKYLNVLSDCPVHGHSEAERKRAVEDAVTWLHKRR